MAESRTIVLRIPSHISRSNLIVKKGSGMYG